MAIHALTPDELKVSSPNASVLDYAAFLTACAIGHGGKLYVEEEGVGRQTLKARLNQAATLAKVALRYPRAGKDVVVFEVLGAAEAAAPTATSGKRRGRPRKDA